MKLLTPAAALFILSFAQIHAADAPARPLKIDRTRSFVDVDVSVTLHSFVAHLDKYDAQFTCDEAGKIKTGAFAFKFAQLKTGDEKRDGDMLAWLGGGDPEGRFLLGVLAVAPDGQGVANGLLTFHGATQRIEFPVNVTQTEGACTISGAATLDYREWGLKVIRKFGLAKVDPVVKVRFKLIGAPVEAPAAKP